MVNCKQCGKAITYPNFIANRFKVMYKEFYECGLCHLNYLVDTYMEFKEKISSKLWHTIELKRINKLLFLLRKGRIKKEVNN